MLKTLKLYTLLGLFLLPTFAGAATPETKALPADGVEALTLAINRLANVLENEQKRDVGKETTDKLKLAIDYLSFRSRRIETLERDLANMKSTRTNSEEAEKTWKERILALEERQKVNQGGENDGVTRMIEETKVQLAAFKERQSRLGEEIVMQENRIYELKKEISSIEKYVEQHLDL